MFENAEIHPDELPAVDAVDWHSMDARFLRRQLTESVLVLIFIVLGIGVMHAIFNAATIDADVDFNFAWLWLAPVIVGIPTVVWPVISVPRMSYAVRERDIIYRSGVFWHTVTAIPFNRIQHVEKSSTPLDRRFQLASLQLFTAGGSGGDLKIHGLSTKTAEKMRNFILEKIGSSVEQG